jgi:hypothetical protein
MIERLAKQLREAFGGRALQVRDRKACRRRVSAPAKMARQL